MPGDSNLYRDLALVFGAAVVGGLVAHRLRQPLILGYVLGGMLVGPFTAGPRLSETHVLELLAEVGVILLMYSIGIEFSLRDLLQVKWVAVAGGSLGILLSVGLGIVVAHLLGWSAIQGAIVGAVISVASTMVLSRLLLDRGELHSSHGRVMIAITLMEDLAVVVMTVLIPVLATARGEYWFVAAAIGKALLLLIPIAFAAAKLVPRIMSRVARIRSEELYLIVALAIGFAIAAATQAIGLSLALGAFLAGMVISESEYKHQTLAQLLPLRDAFVALFFITVGALIDPRAIFSRPALLGVMILMIVIGKWLIWTFVVRLFHYPLATALLVGVGLTQIGEFSYVLVQTARRANLVENEIYNTTLAASLITILINAALMRLVPAWMGKRQLANAAKRLASSNALPLSGHVVLCGFGRVGSLVGTALETFDVPYAVVEMDPDLVAALRTRGVNAIFGDAAHTGVLAHAGVARSRLVVVTVPESSRAEVAIRAARSLAPSVPVLARAHHRNGREQLLRAGASEVIQPEIEASTALVRYALDHLKLPRERTTAFLESFRQSLELAPVSPEASLPMPKVRHLRIPPGVPERSLSGSRVRERFGVTVMAVTKASGEVVVNPPASTRIGSGDEVRVFGLPEHIEAFNEYLQAKAAVE